MVISKTNVMDWLIDRSRQSFPTTTQGRTLRSLYQGFWIYLYFRIRHSLSHLRPVILSADWSISRLQSLTCLSLPTVAEFVKLTQSIVVEAQRQSTDLYKVQLCNWQFFVVSTAIYVVKVYECHPLDFIIVRLPSTREYIFLASTRRNNCLVRVCLLHCMRVRLRNGYMQAYAQIMHYTHTHKAYWTRWSQKVTLSSKAIKL